MNKLCSNHGTEMRRHKGRSAGWYCHFCAHEKYKGLPVKDKRVRAAALCEKHGIQKAKRKPRGLFCYLCEIEKQRVYRSQNPVYHMLMGAKVRARTCNVPFDL